MALEPRDRYRNQSPYELFRATARSHAPRLAFAGGQAPERWRRETLPAVVATLGRLPERVDPRPSLIAEWERDGVHTQKWLIDVEAGLSTTAYVNRPAEPAAERLPGILCWHGHGPRGQLFGKEPVMGDLSSPERAEFVRRTGSDYGFRMAQAGFVTFAIDWMGHGDLAEHRKPNHRYFADADDWCNTYYMHATLLGMTPLGMNVAHGKVLVDFVSELPFVDASRLGVMGLSGGGTMTVWSAVCDDRLRAAEVVCYSDMFADFAFRDLEDCGSQIAPGLFELVDVPDLQGLIYPRPLLVDIAAFDETFALDSAMRCFRQVEAIYEAGGAGGAIDLNLFGDGHRWEGGRSVGFFERHLGASK